MRTILVILFILTSSASCLALENKKKKIDADKVFEKKAEQLAKDYQAVIITQYLNSVYDKMQDNQVMGGGSGERVFQAMLNEERGKLLDLGLTEAIKNQLISINMMRGKNAKNK